jgi:predicted aspartyl protease
MSESFDPAAGLIIVAARLWGPGGDAHLRLALDTGATRTVVRTNSLVSMGYDPVETTKRIRVTTGSGVEYVPLVPINRIDALCRQLRDFVAIAHTLPPSAGVDGVLGLDFLRRSRLTIDFRSGRVNLT